MSKAPTESTATETQPAPVKKVAKAPEYNPSPERPRWRIDRDRGTVMRDIGAGEEAVARYEEATGIVEVFQGNEGMRKSIQAVMRGNNGGFFTRFGRIGQPEEKPPEDAPPRPKMSRRFGEKSKQRLIWHARYLPRTFLEMWGAKQLQVRTGFEEVEVIKINPDTKDRYRTTEQRPIYQNIDGFDYDVDKLISGEQRLLATAKTYLTEKVHTVVDDTDFDDSINE